MRSKDSLKQLKIIQSCYGDQNFIFLNYEKLPISKQNINKNNVEYTGLEIYNHMSVNNSD